VALTIHTILAATDFTAASERPLEYAGELARRFAARLHVIHVLEEPFPTASEVYVAELPEFRERRRVDARRRLDEIVAALTDVAATSDIPTGNPAAQIVQSAAAIGADLIVIGTHGRGALAHLVMGSVAERVVRTAPVPVLTVRAQKAAPAADAAEIAAAQSR
jgi:nucleotide-binding universal stress UspA family protein